MYNKRVVISIIIPTFNRSYYLIKILNNLRSNFINFKNFEVLICDSYSKDNTQIKLDVFKKNNFSFPISYFNIANNNNALKRNICISKAKGKYIILLDDDCVPINDFVKQYYFILKKDKNNKNIYCGSVKYPNYLLNNNLVKYRQSRHFFFKKKYSVSKNELEAKNIVTMNMAFDKDILLKKNLLFNENFNRYGFEDYEFGFRLIKSGFKLIPSSPLIYHWDNRNFSKYLNKIKFIGLESFSFLEKLNYEAAINSIFFKFENNLIFKFLIKNKFFKILLELFEKLSIKIEKSFFYFPVIYKFAFLGAYLQGCIGKFDKNVSQTIRDRWYK